MALVDRIYFLIWGPYGYSQFSFAVYIDIKFCFVIVNWLPSENLELYGKFESYTALKPTIYFAKGMQKTKNVSTSKYKNTTIYMDDKTKSNWLAYLKPLTPYTALWRSLFLLTCCALVALLIFLQSFTANRNQYFVSTLVYNVSIELK